MSVRPLSFTRVIGILFGTAIVTALIAYRSRTRIEFYRAEGLPDVEEVLDDLKTKRLVEVFALELEGKLGRDLFEVTLRKERAVVGRRCHRYSGEKSAE